MKLFVTGAAGFLGAAVVRQALHQGHSVVAMIRQPSSADRLAGLDEGLDVVAADFGDASRLKDLLSIHRPDVVVHAAWSGVSGATRFDRLQITDNIAAVCGLMDAAESAGVGRVVGIGSQGEYGPLEGRTAETKLPEPSTLYGAAKLAALHLSRQLAAQAGMSFAWLRLFSAFAILTPGGAGWSACLASLQPLSPC